MSDRAAIQSVIESLGLTVSSTFVPFSQSRNKDERHKSLNWRVTVFKGAREVLTTDYSAGEGHCPAYKASVKALGGANCIMRQGAIAWECEKGFNSVSMEGYSHISRGKTKLEPDALDVLHSLVMDADVIDYNGFEDWAEGIGYGVDSRSAERIYRSCLDTALKLRNGIGDEGLKALQEAFQDF